MTNRTLSGVLAAAALFAGATSAHAQTAAAPASGTYAVEPGHTQVVFSVLHFGFTTYSGLLSNVTGTLVLDAKNPAKSTLDVTIPVASVQTTSDTLTGELKGADWLDAGKFANATFKSGAVKLSGKTDALVTGTLTLHGVSKPETLKVHFVGAGTNPLDKKYTVGFEATATIKRSDFGVTKYVPLVSDDVKLSIAGAFEKQD